MVGARTPSQSTPYVFEDAARGIFRVARQSFVDAEVLAHEQRLIFDRCWLYLGHASEIANPGDFLARQVGGRELLFVHGKDGELRAFHNTCPHRGAMVCREKAGNGAMFRCFYHSWAFNLEGKLVNRPGDECYTAAARADGKHDLVRVPQLAQYRGLYFVNFQRHSESLVTYLAGAAGIIDLVMDQAESGMEIVGGTQEYSIDANWKLLCENSFDGYHAISTHATYLDYLQSRAGQLVARNLSIGHVEDLGNGHAVIEYDAPWGRPIALAVPAWGEAAAREVAAVKANLDAKFGRARADRMALLNRNMVIFPNLVLNDIMAVTVRTFFPAGPTRNWVNAWTLAPRNEAPTMRERRLFNFLEFLGPGGFATPDDCEALALCQRGYSNSLEAGWNDLSKGMQSADPKVDDEAQMRIFWREWARRIANGAT